MNRPSFIMRLQMALYLIDAKPSTATMMTYLWLQSHMNHTIQLLCCIRGIKQSRFERGQQVSNHCFLCYCLACFLMVILCNR